MAKFSIDESPVVENFNKWVSSTKGKTVKGLELGIALIKRASVRLTPIDTSNLRSSVYTTTKNTSVGPASQIGYTADYAIYVHENLNAYHKKGQAKFLEQAINDNMDRVMQIVAENVKI